MNVFFDVQGTLISGGRARPHVRESFERISGAGHAVYLWSSGGSAYAEQAARMLGVEDLVCGCFSKSTELPVTVDYVVDDSPPIVSGYPDGALVDPFTGDPEDRALIGVTDTILEKPPG